MSTCNFSLPNLKFHYTINPQDEWDWETEIDNIQSELSTIKGYNIEEHDRWETNNRKILGYFDFDYYDKDYKQWDTVSITVVVESGYYEGGMIDVSLSEYQDLNHTKTLENKVNRKLNQIEKVLSKCTTKIIRVAVFSNGEGVYELAK